jgi:hypothetical protein
MAGRAMRHLVLGLGFAGLVPAAPAQAQEVRGRLLDLETGLPIGGGIVSLIAAQGGATVATVETSPDGAYRLKAPKPGRYHLEVRRIGYQGWMDGPIMLAEGQTQQTEFRLPPIALQLDPLEVTAPVNRMRNVLHRVGFYERQRSSFGHFVTPEDIEARRAQRTSDILATIPGVRLSQGIGKSRIRLRGSLLSFGGDCHPRVYVDGLIVIRGDSRPRGEDLMGLPEQDRSTEIEQFGGSRDEIALDDVVVPTDIEAIEVYRSAAQVPAEFGGGSRVTQCGVIVIWTHPGSAQPPR